jgi:glycosyltransferase involved in cell wall biosynthesis
MKLSLVIPTKNEEMLLPRLLRSIREQAFSDYEIIVADAHSTDHTCQLAASFGARIVEGGLPGPGRNRGAAVARGETFMFFDADVILPHPHFLEECLEEMQERALQVSTCRLRADQGTFVDHAMHGAYNAYSLATEKFLPHAGGFCLFATREAHQSIGGFDEEVVFAEDHDYVRRADRAGHQFGILRRNKIPVSVRRLEKDGRFNITMKYMYTELYMLTRGPFKRETPFRYEMGGPSEWETKE